MKSSILAILVIFFAVTPGEGQHTSQSVYDSINDVRSVADSLFQAKDPRALAYLYGMVNYMAQPEIRDLATGWPYLRSRLPDVWHDIAVVEAAHGDTARALHAIEMIVNSGGTSVFAGIMRRDTVMERLFRGNRRYERAILQLQAQARMWGDSAFVTAYRDTLPESERLAGLALVWAEVRYGYPDYQVKPQLSWDSLYVAYIPRVQGAKSTRDYYMTLRRFTAELGDGHTDIFVPAGVGNHLDNPPVRLRAIEGRSIVTSVLSPTLARAGIARGDEIESVNGIPTAQYASINVEPYLSVATQQDMTARMLGGQLLYGPRDSSVVLGVRHASGERVTVTVARSGYSDLIQPPAQRAAVDSLLPGNIGYIRINNFFSDSARILARRAIASFASTDGLIIDIRYNGGGNTYFGVPIIAALIDSTITTERTWTRSVASIERASGLQPQVYDNGPVSIAPDTSLRYRKPVAMLIGPQTFSAAENFAAAFAMAKRGPMVGESTGGSTGQPFTFPLPGGGAARVRTRHHLLPDGREYLFEGIHPDIVVHPTIAAFRKGVDEGIDAAVKAIRAAKQ